LTAHTLCGPDSSTSVENRSLKPLAPRVDVPTMDLPIAPNMKPAVDVVDVAKRYGSKDAVDGVSLTIAAGAFTGLVGPNGAGKTTLLRMLTGLCRPDRGSVSLIGQPVWPDPMSVRQVMGVLPDDLRLFERLSGRELLAYIGLLRGIPAGELGRRSDHLLDVMGFGPSSDELVTDYSTGMRKKIALAAAMIHAPKILFLDEPFESVDPVSVRVLQDVLRAYQQAGGTVVLSSHVMDTVEKLCTYVAIMDRGRIVTSGTVEEIRNGKRLEDVFLATVRRPGYEPEPVMDAANDDREPVKVDDALAWLTSSTDLATKKQKAAVK
jgi:ABC-2 type transport system ATP-binding protein